MIENFIDRIADNFDFGYMFTINVLTYFGIKIIERIKEGKTRTLLKRIVLVIAILFLTGVYAIVGYDNKIVLINSAIASPVFYSWVLKPIFEHYKIGYENDIRRIC